eukprot:gene19038-20951_t
MLFRQVAATSKAAGYVGAYYPSQANTAASNNMIQTIPVVGAGSNPAMQPYSTPYR